MDPMNFTMEYMEEMKYLANANGLLTQGEITVLEMTGYYHKQMKFLFFLCNPFASKLWF
jgi:hypothetical protein